MRSIVLQGDAMGFPMAIVNVSDHVCCLQLIAGQAKQLTVPAGANIALFAATGPFWCRIGGAVTLPTGDISDGTAPELNPAGRNVEAGQILGLVAPAACAISISFYR
ncbi:hypothetical protein [Asticcacaulis sp.]|uniref:hypothetical protein n=1 Tax=Asticcacaulis sp. TaxID=1872648 RepID=UPI0026229DC3|nr:hypothetical protein [Asticcacaulis sp.]